MEQGTWDFGVLVGLLADGELRDEATDELHDLVEKLWDRARASARTTKGKLTIVLDVKCTKEGLIVIEPDVSAKLPRKVRRETPLYIGKHGLTGENPRQQKLPLREVQTEREIKEAGRKAVSDE